MTPGKQEKNERSSPGNPMAAAVIRKHRQVVPVNVVIH